MWAHGIVLDTPGLDGRLGRFQACEPGLSEALLAEAAVEGFNERVVGRFARPTEGQFDVMPMRPFIKYPGNAFRPLSHIDDLRQPMSPGEPLQDRHDTRAGQGNIRRAREALTSPVIGSREDPEALAITEAVGHEGHAPGLVGGLGRRTRHAQVACPLFLGFDTQRKPFEAVPTRPPRVIDLPALPLKEHVEATVTIASPGGGEVPPPHPPRGLILCDTAIPMGGARHGDDLTCPSFTHLEADLPEPHKVTALGRL